MTPKNIMQMFFTNHVIPEELNYHLANTGQLVVQGRREFASENSESIIFRRILTADMES